ncbi:MAG TPA: hypothetical protein VK389_05125 [Thermoanaerobaculia bacterium]|jgi:hypothetical protein|nr:hypothetical protein [Thermoanaerobaculia bacterium]HLN93224.1 hypothetical protein [Thermoanaerobaculia bacterium]
MPLPAGTRVGPYEIVSPLGIGGMGEVYRARDPRLGREIALRVLPEDGSEMTIAGWQQVFSLMVAGRVPGVESARRSP